MNNLGIAKFPAYRDARRTNPARAFWNPAVFVAMAVALWAAPQATAQPGSLDLSFDPGSGANSPVMAVGEQSDGKLIVVGAFYAFTGTNASRTARLYPNGSLDTSFGPANASAGAITNVTVLPDDRVFISGSFFQYNGSNQNQMARLLPDGTLDTTFSAPANAGWWACSVQSNGDVVESVFASWGSGVARLSADGGWDDNFDEISYNRPKVGT
jgi:uncharacterized delta-60 repeat protein